MRPCVLNVRRRTTHSLSHAFVSCALIGVKNERPVTQSNANGRYRIGGGQPGRMTLAGAVTTGGTLLPIVRAEATRPTPGLCRLAAAHRSTATRTCTTSTAATRRTTAATCGREASVGEARRARSKNSVDEDFR